MEKIKLNSITPEREQECIKWIQSSIEEWFENYIKFFNTNKWMMGRIIIDFFRLPKTDLHYEFTEKIIKPHTQLKILKDENIIEDEIDSNQKNAMIDIKLNDENNKNYKIIHIHQTKYWWIITIWIPYKHMEPWKWYISKYAYTMNIEEIKTPNIYKKIIKRYENINA